MGDTGGQHCDTKGNGARSTIKHHAFNNQAPLIHDTVLKEDAIADDVLFSATASISAQSFVDPYLLHTKQRPTCEIGCLVKSELVVFRLQTS